MPSSATTRAATSRGFPIRPWIRVPVNLWRIHATYFYRVSPLLDLGAGAGVMIFTGEGFDSQSHFVMTPLSLVFTPLGFIRSSPRPRSGAACFA